MDSWSSAVPGSTQADRLLTGKLKAERCKPPVKRVLCSKCSSENIGLEISLESRAARLVQHLLPLLPLGRCGKAPSLPVSIRAVSGHTFRHAKSQTRATQTLLPLHSFAGSCRARHRAKRLAPASTCSKGQHWVTDDLIYYGHPKAAHTEGPSFIRGELSSIILFQNPIEANKTNPECRQGAGSRQPCSGCSEQRSLGTATASALLTCASCCHPERSPRTRTCT